MTGLRPVFVISCEHAGNRVPAPYRPLFKGAEAALRSHRGWDPGAAGIARALAAALSVRPILHHDTRLLADTNRSEDNPECFSELTRRLAAGDREALLDRVHRPHRARVRQAAEAAIEPGGLCVHLSVHTFTPVLDGLERDVDVGLLFDPERTVELDLVEAWRARILDAEPELRVRPNAPYLGTDDGLTTTLRAALPDARYAGIEVEVNQRHASTFEGRRVTSALVAAIVEHALRRPAG